MRNQIDGALRKGKKGQKLGVSQAQSSAGCPLQLRLPEVCPGALAVAVKALCVSVCLCAHMRMNVWNVCLSMCVSVNMCRCA